MENKVGAIAHHDGLPFTAAGPATERDAAPGTAQRARALPYFQWDNRDGQPMRVWLPAIMA